MFRHVHAEFLCAEQDLRAAFENLLNAKLIDLRNSSFAAVRTFAGANLLLLLHFSYSGCFRNCALFSSKAHFACYRSARTVAVHFYVGWLSVSIDSHLSLLAYLWRAKEAWVTDSVSMHSWWKGKLQFLISCDSTATSRRCNEKREIVA